MAKRKLLVALTDLEDQYLRAISVYTGVAQAKLIRWAIRLYALQGPWTLEGRKRRTTVIGRTDEIEVGPMMKEGMR